jgi:hypothetical protein
MWGGSLGGWKAQESRRPWPELTLREAKRGAAFMVGETLKRRCKAEEVMQGSAGAEAQEGNLLGTTMEEESSGG